MIYRCFCFLFSLVMLLTAHSVSQFRESVERNRRLLGEASRCLEGFSEARAGQVIMYPRLRSDRTEALITRATTGTASIEWMTERVPLSGETSSRAFFLMAGMYGQDTVGHNFHVFINGRDRFLIATTASDSWEVKGDSGAAMRFDGLLRDQHRDLFGYMRITLPAAWITPGEAVSIRVVGEKEGSAAWFMVYKDGGALSHLREKVANEAYATITLRPDGSGYKVSVDGSSSWAGKQLKYRMGVSTAGIVLMSPRQNGSYGTFILPSIGEDSLKLFMEGETILETVGLFKDFSTTDIYEKRLVSVTSRTTGAGSWVVEYGSKFMPQLGASLAGLSRTLKAGGEAHLVISTHQDIAWMDSPEQCVKDRDEKIITPALRLLEDDPEYRFDLEDVLCLREYLGRHPESRDKLYGLMKTGRLSVGASFTQPYEDLCSGEMLVRQFYAGRRWLRQEFPGCDSHVYWNPDVPARTMQMPQVMAKAGVPYLFMSRFEQGLYLWQSPDSSRVMAFSPGHYALFNERTSGKTFQEFASYLASFANGWNEKLADRSTRVPVISMTDMSGPVKYDEYLHEWNTLKSIKGPGGTSQSLSLPPLHYSAAQEFLDAVAGEHLSLPVVRGERPDIWLYIHGPTHQWAISAKREADIFLPAAEVFSTVNALLAKSFAGYPQKELTLAWEAQVYPDHGWGGKNGEITDSTFRAKYEFARGVAKDICTKATGSVAARVRTKSGRGIPLMVFNSLSWKRTAPVECAVEFQPQAFKAGISISDSRNRAFPLQVLSSEKYPDGSLKKAEILFVAQDIPPVGYATFYLTPSGALPVSPKENFSAVNQLQNRFYTITLGTGGISQIRDREIGKDLLSTEKFLGGELFTMQSVGEDAGEWAEPQQPTMEGFDKLSNHEASWRLVESGPVRNVAEMRADIGHASVLQRIILYTSLKRIDLQTSLLGWDGTKYREFRLAFPLKLQNAQVSYEVPFGSLVVGRDEMKGAAGERYKNDVPAIHPRGIQNWIGASGREFGVTISSSVAVWDYKDPTDAPVPYTVLQPVLLASRRSCHGEGPWYLQKGDHVYAFSLVSYAPSHEDGKRMGVSANVPFMVVVNPKASADTILPETESFFSCEDPDIILSTMKKCEDDDNVILRMYEDGGKGTHARVKFMTGIRGAELTNIIEDVEGQIPLEQGVLKVPMGPHAIQTVKLHPVMR